MSDHPRPRTRARRVRAAPSGSPQRRHSRQPTGWAGSTRQDLGQAGLAAHLSGDDAVATSLMARSTRWPSRPGDPAFAALMAFWLGMMLANRGEMAVAGGWLARSGQLVDEHQARHRRERLPARSAGAPAAGGGRRRGRVRALRTGARGSPSASTTATSRRCRASGAASLSSWASRARGGVPRRSHARGHGRRGRARRHRHRVLRVDRGVPSDLRPPPGAGLDGGHGRAASRRAGLVPFRGRCLVYRAELMRFRGDWPAAIAEASERRTGSSDPRLSPRSARRTTSRPSCPACR